MQAVDDGVAGEAGAIAVGDKNHGPVAKDRILLQVFTENSGKIFLRLNCGPALASAAAPSLVLGLGLGGYAPKPFRFQGEGVPKAQRSGDCENVLLKMTTVQRAPRENDFRLVVQRNDGNWASLCAPYALNSYARDCATDIRSPKNRTFPAPSNTHKDAANPCKVQASGAQISVGTLPAILQSSIRSGLLAIP